MEAEAIDEAEAAGYPAELWASMSERERKIALARSKSASAPDTASVLKDLRSSVLSSAASNGQGFAPAQAPPSRAQGYAPVGSMPAVAPPTEGRSVVPDLVGDRAPRTLADIYARYPIGLPGGEEYFIRVERTQPKSYQGVPSAGYVGRVQGERLDESDFVQRFGGRDYQLTVYGPDPRGRQDDMGQSVIKPLTDPIRHSVPVAPPNLTFLPQTGHSSIQGNMQNNFNPMNPFGGGGFGGQMPTTQADASIHKTNVDFLSSAFQTVLKSQNQQPSRDDSRVLDLVEKTTKATLETQQRESERRERMLEKQAEKAEEERNKLEAQLLELKRGLQAATGSSSRDALELVQALGPNREDESRRREEEARRRDEQHRQQIDSLRSGHEEAMKMLRQQHESENRRSDERLREQELYYTRRMEDLKASQEEALKLLRHQLESSRQELKEELDRQRREMREDRDKELRDQKERHESEVKLIERTHANQLALMRESFDTKIDTRDQTHKMEVVTLASRAEELRHELEKAKQEAAENADPVTVLEKTKAQAEALGYSKDENEPKTAWERFASTAGAGLGQALSTIDQWGPQLVMVAQQQRAMAGAPGARQLPPGAQPGMPQGGPPGLPPGMPQAQQRRRRPVVSWAAEAAPAEPVVMEASTPLGFTDPSSAEPVMQPMTQQPVPQAPVAAPAQQPVPQEPTVSLNIPPKFAAIWQPEAVLGFIQTCDQYINLKVEPSMFAEGMFQQYEAEARKVIEVGITADDIKEFVKQLPNAENAAILRRDGTKWLGSMLSKLKELTNKSAA
jgi:hypothetical protein